MALWIAASAIAGMMLAVWAISVVVKNAGIVDVFWGLGFVLVAWVVWSFDGGHGVRAALLVAMATVWGLRLSIYLGIRNVGKEEDFRYQAMRQRGGPRFWLKSLFRVFALQAVVMWIVSLPLQLGIRQTNPGWEALWFIGAAVFLVGLAFEAVADWQLARFKADPDNSGKVLDKGLWRYSRHPNYFGDATAWWGIGLVAASTPIGTIGLIGPALITWSLLRVSGVPMLEHSLHKNRPGYRDYVKKTSPFIPRRPLVR